MKVIKLIMRASLRIYDHLKKQQEQNLQSHSRIKVLHKSTTCTCAETCSLFKDKLFEAIATIATICLFEATIVYY